MIVCFWFVVGIVGENGVFYFFYDWQVWVMCQCFFVMDEEWWVNCECLNVLCEQIFCEVFGVGIVLDQFYCEVDFVIDFCEDVILFLFFDVDWIFVFFVEVGVIVKVFFIYVNGWFGDYDKLLMI